MVTAINEQEVINQSPPLVGLNLFDDDPALVALLDNLPRDDIRAAVERRDHLAPGVQLEASGGVSLETVADIAAAGVDRISVGAITHSAPALDIGLDWLR